MNPTDFTVAPRASWRRLLRGSVRSLAFVLGVVLGVALPTEAVRASPATTDCPRGKVYLTLDTGNMSQAEAMAQVLARHQVRATFFVADETTPFGNSSLSSAWAGYWKARVSEGHAFGSHTLDHVFFREALPDGRVRVRPQFGEYAGKSLIWDAQAVCNEIDRADQRFRELTGQALDRYWRAPGGRAPERVFKTARQCGWTHVHWSPAGFLGDELPSETHPNERLLKQSLQSIRAGDILMAHLGIWSRKDPWAPMLEPLIQGLKARGLCFATLRDHPDLGAR